MPKANISEIIDSMKDLKVRQEMIEDLKEEDFKTLTPSLRKEALRLRNDCRAVYIGLRN